ncbi:hypothetical protein DICVIV_12497 [Dictyocaulus viviparus]|uniref:Uncharacterized protein n=1 Tax=Dictyocaulus viviparus TaxID=29172 RepID=A0A0D8XAA1_DICVI|nr:hypothetical protein DICVIV_12497 [Dictyocaulus viviparus]
MGELESESDALEHFVASGRAGRRNALPEIEMETNDPGAVKLADRLSDLSAQCDENVDVSQRGDQHDMTIEIVTETEWVSGKIRILTNFLVENNIFDENSQRILQYPLKGDQKLLSINKVITFIPDLQNTFRSSCIDKINYSIKNTTQMSVSASSTESLTNLTQ